MASSCFRFLTKRNRAFFLQNAFDDYATTNPRIVLERREHTDDPNKDARSDFETVNLHVLNAVQQDQGYYMCIVANSLRSFRVTYAFLNVLNTPTGHNALNQSTHLDLLVAQSFFERNKSLVTLISLFAAAVVVIVTLGFCFCCFQLTRRQKQDKKARGLDGGKKRCAGLGDEMPDTEKMNSLLEKTMTSMRKVRAELCCSRLSATHVANWLRSGVFFCRTFSTCPCTRATARTARATRS